MYDPIPVTSAAATEQQQQQQQPSPVAVTATERTWREIKVPKGLGLDAARHKWRQNLSHVEVFVRLPDTVNAKQVCVWSAYMFIGPDLLLLCVCLKCLELCFSAPVSTAVQALPFHTTCSLLRTELSLAVAPSGSGRALQLTCLSRLHVTFKDCQVLLLFKLFKVEIHGITSALLLLLCIIAYLKCFSDICRILCNMQQYYLRSL